MTIDSNSLNRRNFLGGAVLAGAASGLASAMTLMPGQAQAAAPLAGKPVAGALRRKHGDFEITALLDGYLDTDEKLVIGFDEQQAAQMRSDAFIEGEGIRIPINAYLVNTGDKLVLIDAGTSGALGPTLGHLGGALAAAGVTPEQIDAVLITHMHPDHLFGVATAENTKMFPNAELILPETDRAFWFDDANLNAAPDQMKAFFNGARAAANLYGDRQTLFAGEGELLPGIRPLSLPGHTPGHHGFVLESNGETLVVAGDILHFAPYQFAQPDWGIAFDIDPAVAAATRKRFFDQMAADRVMFAGAHVPFPGFGHVARDGQAYRFTPADWQYAF